MFKLLKSLALSCVLCSHLSAEVPFGMPGANSPANLEATSKMLKESAYAAEILMSFANSTKGSAGHLALSLRNPDTGSETVYSANFYADRTPEHADSYNDELIMAIPKDEYIYGTQSSISPKAHFGLDFGEIYKRSLIGVRIYGLTKAQVEGVASFYTRLNQDYKNQLPKSDYHNGPIVYDYMNINCAKTVALALKHGAGLNVKIRGENFLGNIGFTKPLVAHTPSGTTMDILDVAHKAGLSADVVLYKKYEFSEFVNLEDPKLAFKDLPNRFPSVPSLDYLQEAVHFDDYSNLFCMHLLYNLGRYSLIIPQSRQEILLEKSKEPMKYEDAVFRARTEAKEKSKNLLRRLIRAFGLKLFPSADNSDLYSYEDLQSANRGESGDYLDTPMSDLN